MRTILTTIVLSVAALAQGTTPTLELNKSAYKDTHWDMRPNGRLNFNWDTITTPLISCGDTTRAVAWEGIAKKFVCQAVNGAAATITESAAGTEVAGNGAGLVAQARTVLDVRDYGADCSGATDSSAALNSLTSSQDASNGKIIYIPRACALRLNSRWLIFGQEYLTVDGGGGINASGGSLLFGCGGSAGPVVLVSRSTHFYMTGVTIVAKGNVCASKFTQSLQQANSAAGGYTNTNFHLNNFFLTSALNGTPISGYVGWSNDTGPNQEMTKLENGYIHCQNSTGSSGLFSQTINADSTEIEHVTINGCYRGINEQSGKAKLFNSNLSANGGFSVFGSGGASIWHGQNGCVNTILESVFAEGSGQWINASNDAGGGDGCMFLFAEHNQVSFGDIDPLVYAVNIGNTGARNQYVLIGNHFTAVGAVIHNNTLIGTDFASSSGPGGGLTAFGNLYDTVKFTQAEASPPHGFQNGMWTWGNHRSDGAFAPTMFLQPLTTPAKSSSSCIAGQTWADTNFIYVCTANSKVKRVALSTF